MVARAGGYYVKPFFGERVVTQGEPLLTNIFNVVVEAVLRHWESMAGTTSAAMKRPIQRDE